MTDFWPIAVLICCCAIATHAHTSWAQPGSGALSPSEWTRNFTQTYCSSPGSPSSSSSRWRNFSVDYLQEVCPVQGHGPRGAQNCRREPTCWRWFYVDELELPLKRLVRDASAEERIANILYVSALVRPFKNDMNFYKFNSAAGGERQNSINKQRVAGPQVNDDRCAEQLQQMLDLLQDYQANLAAKRRNSSFEFAFEDKHVYLTRVLDSYGRYSSGYFLGRYQTLGSHDQCLSSQLLLGESVQVVVPTRYCLANIRMDRHRSRELKQRQRFAYETGDAFMQAAICIPETCHSKSFDCPNRFELVKKLIGTQLFLPQTIFAHQELDVESVFCLVDSASEHERLSPGAKLFLTIGCIWLVALAYNTYAGARASEQSPGAHRNRSMDLLRSFASLTADSRLPAHETRAGQTAVDLSALASSKAIAQMMIILLHAGSFMGAFSNDTLHAGVYAERNPLLQLLFSFTSTVDTFSVLSAIILTYNLLKKFEHARALGTNRSGGHHKASWLLKVWLSFALKRYLRLVPMLFLVFAFKKTLFKHLGNGPLWDKGLNKHTTLGHCLQVQSWWSPFDFSALLIPVALNCVTVSWSIANEIFFALLMPPFAYSLCKRPKCGLALTGLIIISATAISYYTFHTADPKVFYMLSQLRFIGTLVLSTSQHHLLVHPFFRLPAFLAGVIAGWFLFHHQPEQVSHEANERRKAPSTFKWPWWFSGPLTCLALLLHLTNIVISCTVTSHVRKIHPPSTKYLYLMLFSTNRLLLSFAYAVVFLRIATDWRTTSWLMRNLFIGKIWLVLDKLNYLLLLVHWDVMNYDLGSAVRELYASSNWIVWSIFTRCYAISLLLSSLLHILVQNPLNHFLQEQIFQRLT